MNKRQRGFSIPELLVVITAIGILASIVLVTYSGIQARAQDAAVQSDLDNISGLLESYRQRQDGTNPVHEYPRSAANLQTLGIKASKSAYNTTVTYNMIYCIANSGANAYKEYKLIGLSKSGNIFIMTQDGFTTHSLTASSLTSTVCSTSFGMGLVSNGLYAPNTWQDWVGNT